MGTDTNDTAHVTLTGVAQPRGGRPGAATVLNTDRTKVVVFEFDAGDNFPDHAVHHPTLIQVIRGHVEFVLGDVTYELSPGELLHVPALATHSVHATQATTLTVTMLLAS